MKTIFAPRVSAAFTLRELQVVLTIVVLGILGWMIVLPLLEQRGRRRTGTAYRCLNNLRHIALAMHQWQNDGGEGLLTQAYTTAERDPGALTNFTAAALFRSLSNYLDSPQRLVCPAIPRPYPTNFVALTATNFNYFIALNDTNVSYFIALNRPGSGANTLMGGDRALTLSGKGVPSGPLLLTSNTPPGWAKNLHSQHRGGLMFADGHSEISGTNRLRAAFAPPAPATNWLILP